MIKYLIKNIIKYNKIKVVILMRATSMLSRTPVHQKGAALDRKRVSDSFHDTSYPSFGYSCGPFRVYEHSQAKGTVKTVEKTK